MARLRFLKQYNIHKAEEIIRVLTEGILVTEKLESSDRKYLIEFAENPGRSLKLLADRIGVNVSSVTRAYLRLREAIQFRFHFALNFPLFRLKHFVVYFKPNESFRRSMLSAREITRNLNCDTFGGWMWASFLVPNQDRILREFTGSLARFADERLQEHRLYEVRSFARHSNFSMFDGKKWFFSEEALSVGAFKYAEANGEILPRLNESMYADKPIRFDQVDLMLSLNMVSESVTKNSELRRVLKEGKYGDLSRVTVSRRLSALKRNGAFFPHCSFSGLGLDTAIVFAAECDGEALETFYHMFPLLPDCWVNRTDKGVIGMVKTPTEMSPRISYLMESLRGEMQDLILISRFENLGSRTMRHLVRHWNDEKQLWEFQKGFFDLSKPAKV